MSRHHTHFRKLTWGEDNLLASTSDNRDKARLFVATDPESFKNRPLAAATHHDDLALCQSCRRAIHHRLITVHNMLP